ncbi:MAG: HD domain-containing protein [Blastocatellia bacterium]
MPQRNYRDPLHNIISLDESVGEDRLIVELIDSAEFQRLRRIRQLGLAMYTYQGAEHSRFTHSIGVMHLMTRALDQQPIRDFAGPEARAVGRAGALLHDVGHGPFSHLIEKVFHINHEDWTRRIILDPDTEVNQILVRHDSRLPDKLAALYEYTYSPGFVSQLVSSQLDCDRMDYLLRDSLMTGVKYGVFDLEWILHALRIEPQTGRIYVDRKGIHAVEEYLQARYYMFRQVYFHRTLRSAEAVLVSALTRARELTVEGKMDASNPHSAFDKMLLGEPLSIAEYLELDDTNLLFNLKQWTSNSDPILSDLSRRLVHRKLFKAADLEIPADELRPFFDEASQAVSAAGFDPQYYMVVDRASDIPYYGYYQPRTDDRKGSIYVEAPNQFHLALREISEVSEVVRGMRAYSIDRICFPAELSGTIFGLLKTHSETKAGLDQAAPSGQASISSATD